MLTRLLGVVSMGLLLALIFLGSGLLASPVAAVEEGETPLEEEELPSIDEVGSQNEISEEFLPEPAENPPFTAALLYPLMAIAFIAVLVTLFLYLKWQPRFGRERKQR